MADYIKKRTHIIGHVRFLDAGPIARDLYDWGMLWSGQQETDGEIPMTALLASAWGAGGRKNVVVAAKLVEVGLWERTDAGWRICKWTEQGNVTKEHLTDRRKAERDRQAAWRAAKVSRSCHAVTNDVTNAVSTHVVTTFNCIGSPVSDLDLGRSEDPTGTRATPPPANDTTPPAWWEAACETVAANVAPVSDRGARWLEYVAARSRKGWAKNQQDAVGWLSTVVRSELSRAPRSSQRGTGGGPRGDRQGLGGWTPPASTGTDDPFGSDP